MPSHAERLLPACRIAATILSLCGAIVTPPPASAQERDQRAILTLTVNMVPAGEVVVIVRSRDVLIEPRVLDRAGVQRYAGRREAIGGRDYVSLASLAPGIRYVLNEADLALAIEADAALLGTTALSLSIPRPEYRFSRSASAFLNYGANWTQGPGADGSVEIGLSIGPAVAQNTASWDRVRGTVRGSTSLVVDRPDKLQRWTVGDSLVPGEGLASGVFFGGVRVAKDYGLDPYFVQYPTLGLSGTTLTPSTVDVYVNGSLVSRHAVAPGTFTLDHVPMPNGSNDTRVVVKDAFGREQQMTAPFYLSTATLARGLHDYDYAVGFPREDSTSTWSYGALSAVARHRYGFTDTITGGLAGEASRRSVVVGPTANLRLGRGEVELGASVSRGGGRTGAAWLAALGRRGRVVTINVRVRSMTSAYTTMLIDRPGERVRVEASGSLGVHLFSRASVSLQQAATDRHDGARSSRTSLAGSVRVSRSVSLFLSSSRIRQGGEAGVSFYAGLGIAVGRSTSASVWAQGGSDGAGASADVQRSVPLGTGLGYRARAALGGNSLASGVVEARVPFGRYEIGQDVIDGQSSARVSATGGLVMIGGGVHATRAVSDSYALVRVPDVRGVRTFLNNQEVGRTNRRGDTLVPDLMPYYANRIGISDQDVPFDLELEAVEQSVAPPYRGGALVTFAARRHQALTGTLAVAVGSQTIVPAMGDMTVAGDGRSWSSPIGSGGEFYLENLPPGDHQAVVAFAGGRCLASLHVPTSSLSLIRLGIVPCSVPGTLAQEQWP